MNLKVGIVGLPNVGKSTLFNALLKKQTAHVANYPFATIEPNVGIVEVPDERLPKLAQVVKTSKIVPAVVEFYDIAGLVEGAHKGEGLGNQFLSHIREVSVIAHVVRRFEDSDIIHVSNRVNPDDDIKIIEEELQFADLQTLNKQKEPKNNATKEEVATYEIVKKVREKLNQGISVRDQNLSDKERELIRQLNPLTMKPVLYCFNSSIEQLENDQLSSTKFQTNPKSKIQNPARPAGGSNSILFNPLVEETLDEMIKKAYEALDLISFLTAGEKSSSAKASEGQGEVRAWTIKRGTLAPQAAGTIHTDFEKGFIKADIASYDDFIALGGWNRARDEGKVRIAGKDYVVQDGDVIDFKVNT